METDTLFVQRLGSVEETFCFRLFPSFNTIMPRIHETRRNAVTQCRASLNLTQNPSLRPIELEVNTGTLTKGEMFKLKCQLHLLEKSVFIKRVVHLTFPAVTLLTFWDFLFSI